MIIFLCALSIIMVFIMYYIEGKRVIRITPIICLGLPYSLVMLIVAIADSIVSDHYDKMGLLVPIVYMMVAFLFWSVGVLLLSLLMKGFSSQKIQKCYENRRHKVAYKHQGFLDKLLLLNTVIIVVYILFNFGIHIHDLNAFKNQFSSGIIAHLINLESVLLLMNYSSSNNSRMAKLLKVLVVPWIVFLSLGNAKYSMLIFTSAIVLVHYLSGKKRYSFSRVAVAIALVSLTFFLTYSLRFLSLGYSYKTIPYSFILNHFYYYLTSGYYSFSHVLSGGSSPTPDVGYAVFFGPLINIGRLLNNKPLVSSISHFIPINAIGGYTNTNAYTLPGSLLLETNWLGLIICIVILSITAYALYYLYINYYSDISIVIYSYFSATLMFSFFNCFYGTLNIWETMFFLLILFIFDRIKIKFSK